MLHELLRAGRIFLALTLASDLAVLTLAAEQAPVLEGRDLTVAKLERDVPLFSDRNYTLRSVPEALEGQQFLRASMTRGQAIRCVEPGTLYALTPTPDHPRASSQQATLLELGFTRVDLPPFQLYGKEPTDICAVFRKDLTAGERLKLGKWAVLLGGTDLRLVAPRIQPWCENDGELLYNGIRLPQEWPPHDVPAASREPLPVPYLDAPPAVINIAVGRQLFVDDFLIERTTLRRTFHQAVTYEGNPVLKPETPLETRGGWVQNDSAFALASSACPFDDGVAYDPADGLFKLWYMGGVCRHTLLATSQDGLHWVRPELGLVGGANCVIPYRPEFSRDSFSPWLDPEAAAPAERFKAFLYARTSHPPAPVGHAESWLYTSPDGIRWRQGPKLAASVGDNTSLFYNPFRKKWVLSVRSHSKRGRVRSYFEAGEFSQLAAMKPGDPVFWAGADRLDPPDPVIGRPTQLYCLNPVAYESLMLGAFCIHSGPENGVCEQGRFPKLTQIKLGFSRDGFHWARPDRSEFIAATQRAGDWDRAYLRPANGFCTVVGDRLYFYYSGILGSVESAAARAAATSQRVGPISGAPRMTGGSRSATSPRRCGVDAAAAAGWPRRPSMPPSRLGDRTLPAGGVAIRRRIGQKGSHACRPRLGRMLPDEPLFPVVDGDGRSLV